MNHFARDTLAVCMAAVGMLGACTPDRPAPGSDLPPTPAQDGGCSQDAGTMQPGSHLAGTYVALAHVITADKLVPVDLALIWSLQDSGAIAQGNGKMAGTVYIDGYEAKTKKDFSDVPIANDGSFELTIQNMIVPKELSALLNEDVTESTLEFQCSQVLSSCEFEGHLKATLKNVNSGIGQLPEVLLDGDFASNGGSDPSCPGVDAGTPEAGEDAEGGADTAPADAPAGDADGAADGSNDAIADAEASS